jgi:putative toxin-antitoxin system antitoxin component (TIGR02293 family)
MAALLNPIALGASASLKTVEKIRAGLPFKSLENLAATLKLSPEETVRIFSITARTLARRKRGGRLSAEESDRVYRVARILAHAADLLGDEAEAAEWLRAPNIALGMATPISLLDTDAGTQQVQEVLGRIEYGMYS